MPPATDRASSAFGICWECAQNQATAEANFKAALERELNLARTALLDSSRKVLPAYLVFGAGEFRERLSDIAQMSGTLPPRNARARERERHLLLYLQRVCAKNDTFSKFGPSAWGKAIADSKGFEFSADAEITKRESFLERWTAHAVAAAVNQDLEAKAEMAPRLNPNGRMEENAFFLTETNERILLDPETLVALRQCDGNKSAHKLPLSMERLHQLARQNIIRWQLEIEAMEPRAFEAMLESIRHWRDTPARARWLEMLEPIAALPASFLQTTDVKKRIALMDDGRQRLTSLGIEQKNSQRHLYAAANPIAEECFRDSKVKISGAMLEQFATKAQPWIDLWRDTYAFVADRVANGLRHLLDSTPKQDGAVPLPAFLRHCANNQMPLTAHGSITLAHAAFQEVKEAFRKQVESRAEAEELELTTDDCHVVRNNFDYPKFDEYTYPSADLQISAPSPDAIANGDYRWVLAELHPPPALLHHCFYWSCPDRAALSDALASTTYGKPNFHFGFGAADFTAHTTVQIFDALPELTYFVAPQRGRASFPNRRAGRDRSLCR